ncbi:hypothetical protein [Salinithrix halophila]|uniref:Uncharacterized protein n=1 Tax=Salinithrix halophila TaxID=1485204 RepID=A0ABV8JHP8_9BACL
MKKKERPFPVNPKPSLNAKSNDHSSKVIPLPTSLRETDGGNQTATVRTLHPSSSSIPLVITEVSSGFGRTQKPRAQAAA